MRQGCIPAKNALIIGLLAIFSLLYSCNRVPDKEVIFIGDSIISRWDLEEGFPAFTTINLGIGGSGIKYIESMAHTAGGRTAVILCGTNDLAHLKNNPDNIKAYTLRYIDAVANLDAGKVFVISILPREFQNEDSLLPTITALNLSLSSAINSIPDFYFVDVYDQFIYNNKLDYDLFEDNLHLTPQGYQILNETVRKILNHEAF